MVQRTQVATPAAERHRQAVERELNKFEKQERELMAQERQERAAQLGLPYLVSRSGP
jgi:hypothetical protein